MSAQYACAFLVQRELGSLKVGSPYPVQQVKNIARPVRAYSLGTETKAAAPFKVPPLLLVVPDKPSFAVLPLQNMSDDPEQDY